MRVRLTNCRYLHGTSALIRMSPIYGLEQMFHVDIYIILEIPLRDILCIVKIRRGYLLYCRLPQRISTPWYMSKKFTSTFLYKISRHISPFVKLHRVFSLYMEFLKGFPKYSLKFLIGCLKRSSKYTIKICSKNTQQVFLNKVLPKCLKIHRQGPKMHSKHPSKDILKNQQIYSFKGPQKIV